jgi:ABC-type glycerol-3-phosphate transport system substrate-binding protein
MADRQNAFEELSRRYQEATGVRIVFELFAPSEAYAQKVRAAAQGANLPDIFGILGEKQDLASFIKAGHILSLDRVMQKDNGAWKDSFVPQALAMNEFGVGNGYGVSPGIYGVPIDVMTIQMVYNRSLLRQLGLDPDKPPQTFEEFVGLGPKIKDAGIQGLVSGWGETWLLHCLANNFAFNIMGEDKVLATIRGEVPYTDPDWVAVLGLFQRMRDSGVLANGVVTMINKNAEQLFANGKALFAFDGSWCVNIYGVMNPGLDYGVMLPPRASDRYPMSIWGGAGSSLMVNARCRHPEAAIAFLAWLTAREQQIYLAGSTSGIPANRDCLAAVSDGRAPFVRGLAHSTHPYLWDASEYPQVVEALGRGIQSIIIKEKTPEQVAADVRRVKERQAQHAS